MAVFEVIKINSFGIIFGPADGDGDVFGDGTGRSDGFEKIEETGDETDFGDNVGFFDLRNLSLAKFLGIKISVGLLLLFKRDEVTVDGATTSGGIAAGNSPGFGDGVVGILDIDLALEGSSAGDGHEIVKILVTGRVGERGEVV